MANQMEINTQGNWRLYWGDSPIPHGMTAIGTIKRDILDTGALFRAKDGRLYQGNAGTLRSLPRIKTEDAQEAL